MADSIALPFIKVALDGTITYEFDGHIIARGLDLLASTSLTPPEDRKVRFLRESDGSPVGYLAGTESGAGEGQDWRAHLQAGTDTYPGGSSVELLANTDAVLAELDVTADHAGFAFLRALAGGHQRKLLDSNGVSDLGLDYGIRTTLPPANIIPSRVSGARCILVDNLAAPTWRWQLVYNPDSGNASKWEVVGGSPIINTVAANRTITALADASVPTDPITFNLPFAGDWDIRSEADLRVPTAGQNLSYGHRVGATSRLRTSTALISYQGFSTLWTGITAGTTVVERAFDNVSGGQNVGSREIRAMPIRIG